MLLVLALFVCSQNTHMNGYCSAQCRLDEVSKFDDGCYTDEGTCQCSKMQVVKKDPIVKPPHRVVPPKPREPSRSVWGTELKDDVIY